MVSKNKKTGYSAMQADLRAIVVIAAWRYWCARAVEEAAVRAAVDLRLEEEASASVRMRVQLLGHAYKHA
eukprot:COSAG05_NODE_885_length_6763_cov_10.115396_9_plen_70_part_00